MDGDVKVVMGSDHRGLRLKEEVVSHLSPMGCSYAEAFLSTPFEAGRHTRRIEKIRDLEGKKV